MSANTKYYKKKENKGVVEKKEKKEKGEHNQKENKQ